MRSNCVALVFLITLGSVHAADAPAPAAWNHNPESNSGPPFWGQVSAPFATCGAKSGSDFVEVGMRQTPIDIVTGSATKMNLAALSFHYRDTPQVVENNGHVIEVPYEPGSTIQLGQSAGSALGYLSWSQQTDQYQLVQFHFHAPSEHTVDGKRYDMELHLVHSNILGELAVVGVFMTATSAGSPIVDQIMSQAAHDVRDVPVPGAIVNARNLLPDNRSFYMYAGSLTTPPCTEGVRWFVLRNVVNVSNFAVQQMHQIVSQFPGYNGFADNDRPIVPLNGRTVLVDGR